MAAFERMNQTLIVVPTYNEKENLSRIVSRLLALPVPVDVLIVDGSSTDGTGEIADALAVKHPEIHVLHEKEKRGLGRAYLASFTALAQLPDLWQGMAKALVFGLIAAIVAAYKGMNAGGGPKGVGDAVNESVVITFMLLFVVNFVMSAIYFQLVPPKTG